MYVDRCDGLWHYTQGADYPWTLLAKTDHKQHNDFVVGSSQNHASVRHLAPFLKLTHNGVTFEFPPELHEKGSKVWIDMQWLYNDGVDSMVDYIGPLKTDHDGAIIGGEIVKHDPTDPEVAIVSVNIAVPVDKLVTRYVY